MRYRKLDANGDRVFGGSLADFWIDVPDAPAQAVKTRLMLFAGEWFLDRRDGTPWNMPGLPVPSRVLGKFTGSTRDPVLRARILATPGVTAIASYGSQLDRDTRAFAGQVTIDTAYGRATVQEPR